MANAMQTVSATGRRKNATARVRMTPGTGNLVVNGKVIDDYFPREVLCMRIRQAFEAAGVEDRYDVVAAVRGGGVAGQADALRHGISRALEKCDETLRAPLKRKGFLTRDARKKDAPWTRLVSGTMSKRSAHWAAEESDKSDDEDEEEDLGSTSSDSDETAGEEEEVKRDQWTR